MSASFIYFIRLMLMKISRTFIYFHRYAFECYHSWDQFDVALYFSLFWAKSHHLQLIHKFKIFSIIWCSNWNFSFWIQYSIFTLLPISQFFCRTRTSFLSVHLILSILILKNLILSFSDLAFNPVAILLIYQDKKCITYLKMYIFCFELFILHQNALS